MRIAVSGHRDLHGRTARIVTAALDVVLAERAHSTGEPLVGLTCLADGADQMFADAVLRAGGSLHVIVPATEYRNALPDSAHTDYDRLLTAAAHVHALDHQQSTSQAHMDASILMLDNADELIAVWDGRPARGYGGTADVVEHARTRSIPVTVIWPDGATRQPAP